MERGQRFKKSRSENSHQGPGILALPTFSPGKNYIKPHLFSFPFNEWEGGTHLTSYPLLHFVLMEGQRSPRNHPEEVSNSLIPALISLLVHPLPR